MNQLAIYNMAITEAGGRNLLSALSENNRESQLCNLWYTSARDEVFRLTYMPESLTTETLAELAERDFNVDWTSADPPPPWKYAYAWPANALGIRRIFPVEADTTAELPASRDFKIGTLEGAKAIFTNVENAAATFTVVAEDPDSWDIHLALAVTYTLAEKLALALTGKPAIAQLLRGKAVEYKALALVTRGNSDNRTYTLEGDAITMARNSDYEGYSLWMERGGVRT